MLAWAKELTLVNLHARASPTQPEVPICNKSTRHTHAIDAVWVSPGISPVCCRMTGFGEYDIGQTDHRLLWLDVDSKSIFGYETPNPEKQPANFFPINDPAVVQRYNPTCYTRMLGTWDSG